jgi:hypothetical protein
MVTLTKELLLKIAEECRSFVEMSAKLEIHHVVVSKYVKLFGILSQVREIFRTNRMNNPVWVGIYRDKESILQIARTSKYIADIGRKLDITRERARQILNKLGIKKEVETILDMNKYGVEIPKENKPAVFSLYFKNDPSGRKFFAYSKNPRHAIEGYYRWLKEGKKITHPLIQACKKYGISNLKWDLIKECPVGDLKKEAHRVVSDNIGNSMNLKAITGTRSRSLYMLNQRMDRMRKQRKLKKSKYEWVYYHRLSGLWAAKPKDPITQKQKYLGYWPTEDKAHEVAVKWIEGRKK